VPLDANFAPLPPPWAFSGTYEQEGGSVFHGTFQGFDFGDGTGRPQQGCRKEVINPFGSPGAPEATARFERFQQCRRWNYNSSADFLPSEQRVNCFTHRSIHSNRWWQWPLEPLSRELVGGQGPSVYRR